MDASTARLIFCTAFQLGQHLRYARRRKKLTQRDVANQMNLSQNRISYLELHPEDISVQQLLSWCAIVGLELSIGEREAFRPDVEW